MAIEHAWRTRGGAIAAARVLGAGFLMLALTASAWALEFKSMAAPAVGYDAPSDKARPVFVVARGTPVEVVVSLDRWVKVRDASGELLWVERRVLSDKRMLMVTVAQAQVRTEASDQAPVVFEVAKDVLLEWVEPGPLGWVKVRHAEGQLGFVRMVSLWGL
jgi:SH3-like domain-containing protein